MKELKDVGFESTKVEKKEDLDLKLVIGTKKQAKLEQLLKASQEEIINNEIDTILRKAVIKACEDAIIVEKILLNNSSTKE